MPRLSPIPRPVTFIFAFIMTLLVAEANAAGSPPAPAPATAPVVMMGAGQTYQIEGEDVFVDIARRFDIGFNALRAANPDVDPWVPKVGSEIILPLGHILPDAPHRGIVINLSEQRLYYFQKNGEIRSFPIGVVRDGMTMPRTPGKIIGKRKHPTWTPPASVRKEHPDLPRSVPPGPDNPMGDYALYTSWPEIRIHGTNQPMGVGRRVSHGCIRLYPEDIEWMFNHVKYGTPLTVVDQPVKTAWQGNMLYLEVQPRLQDADTVEDSGHPPALTGNDPFTEKAIALVIKAAGEHSENIDWAQVNRQIIARDGMPHPILLP